MFVICSDVCIIANKKIEPVLKTEYKTVDFYMS